MNPMGPCPICTRREPRTPQVCDACRSRLRYWLRELPDLVAQLASLGPVTRDGRARTVVDDETGRRRRTGWPADPVAHWLPPGPLPGAAAGPRVSGGDSDRTPARLSDVDLTAQARAGAVSDGHGDQIGELSVATVLDQWARDWREHRHAGERLPDPVVTTLSSWLLTRVDDACDHHPAIVEFADELRHLIAVLRAANGLTEWDEYKAGVPCRRCDTLSLWRPNGSDFIECANCPELLTPDEYDRWCKLLAARETDRHADRRPPA